MALEAGSTLGHYEVLSSLGAGGMGEVYRAKDTKLGREVAIKLLLDEVSADPERLARFEREARLLASLNHPNIATLHGFETAEDTSFLVMELVEGETLADRIARGPIPVEDAIPLFVQIAKGLEAAHEHGVIHRDLKPANLKLTAEGAIKILDFGLAKVMASETSGEALSESPTLSLAATRRGEILGTAAYMSPEQARGEPVDRRTDVWAFGVCLWEVLAKRRPFDGATAADTLAKVLERDPDWNALPSPVPPSLRRLLERCLRKSVDQRLQHIGDARLELEEEIASPSSSQETLRGRGAVERSSLLPWAVGAAIGATVAGLVVWSLVRAHEPPPRPPVRTVLSVAPSAPVAVTAFGHDLTITPDGRAVVYYDGNGSGGLYVRRLDRLEGTHLAGTEGEGVSDPFVSPDGAWIAFPDYQNFTLKKVSMLGGPVTTLCRMPGFINGATWGADDSIVFGVNGAGGGTGGLYRVPGAGGEPESLVTPEPEQGVTSYRWPHFLPGGKALLFTTLKSQTAERSKIVLLTLETREQRVLVAKGSHARYARTGHLVYGLEDKLWAVAFDLEKLEVRGSPAPVLEDVATKGSGAVNFDFSEDGSLVYVTGGSAEARKSRLVWVDREGREEAISAEPRNYRTPRISPDGGRVAVSSVDEDRDLWVWDFDRQILTRVTVHSGQDTYSLWTADGRSLIFGSTRGGSFDLYRKAADGTGPVERLTESSEARYPASVSPDEKWVIYRTGLPGRYDLGLLSLEEETSEPLLASEFDEPSGQVSPDGRWLAYQSDESGENRIYVVPFPKVDGDRVPISAGAGSEPLWSPDGSELFYRAGDSMVAVPIQTEAAFEAGSPEELFKGTYAVGRWGNYDVSPDGERFLMIKPVSGAEKEGATPQIVLVQNFFEELERLLPTD